MHTVFLSSTFVDLQPERQAVRDAILRLQQRYSGMEYFGSDPERPIEVSLRLLEESSLYVGIIAHRYGTVERTSGKSITQLEYEKARKAGIPTLIYLKDSKSPVEPTSQFIDFERENQDKLAEFKMLVSSECVVQTFISPHDLAAKVTADIAKLMVSKSGEERTFFPPSYDFEITSADVSLIPMVGGVGVGKTVYGCVLFHESNVLEQNKLLLKMDYQQSHLFNAYEYLKRGEWAPKTGLYLTDGVEFTLWKKTIFGSRPFALRLLDTSGEHWHNALDPEYHFRTHRQSRSIILDNMSRCRALAIFLAVKEDTHYYHKDYDLLYANVIAQLGRDYPSGRFPKPVALILTKCDLTPELLVDVSKPSLYLRDEYPFIYGQVQSKLKTYSVFAVSSVGRIDSDGKPLGLNPIGVWEPIIWLVNEL